MVQIWKDPELEQLLLRRLRQGELLMAIGLTAVFTWLASALPNQHQTHVSIWPPILVAGGIAAAGIYVVVAVESGKGWLPGRKSVLATQEQRAMAAGYAVMHDTSSERDLVRAIEGIGTAVRDAARIARGEPLSPPISPPLAYQLTQIRQVLPALRAIGPSFQRGTFHSAWERLPRTDVDPLFEPMPYQIAVLEGLPKLVQLGELEQDPDLPTGWRFPVV